MPVSSTMQRNIIHRRFERMMMYAGENKMDTSDPRVIEENSELLGHMVTNPDGTETWVPAAKPKRKTKQVLENKP